jgi:hypothetical protein
VGCDLLRLEKNGSNDLISRELATTKLTLAPKLTKRVEICPRKARAARVVNRVQPAMTLDWPTPIRDAVAHSSVLECEWKEEGKGRNIGKDHLARWMRKPKFRSGSRLD